MYYVIYAICLHLDRNLPSLYNKLVGNTPVVDGLMVVSELTIGEYHLLDGLKVVLLDRPWLLRWALAI